MPFSLTREGIWRNAGSPCRKWGKGWCLPPMLKRLATRNRCRGRSRHRGQLVGCHPGGGRLLISSKRTPHRQHTRFPPVSHLQKWCSCWPALPVIFDAKAILGPADAPAGVHSAICSSRHTSGSRERPLTRSVGSLPCLCLSAFCVLSCVSTNPLLFLCGTWTREPWNHRHARVLC